MSLLNLFDRTTEYKGFKISISKRADGLYYYTITEGGLTFPVMSSQGEQTKDRAIMWAKEFIEDHL